MASAADPLPPWALVVFTQIEPVLDLIGAFLAAVNTESYLLDLTGRGGREQAMVTRQGLMAVRQLGSCWFLFALVACVLVRRACVLLRDQPVILKQLLNAYFIPIACADILHVGFTFLDLGTAALLDWKNYNALVIGNTAVTLALFACRMAWFAGVGVTRPVKVKAP